MSGNQTINVVGVLTLQASGTIINPGTIRVGVFTDLGGTIQGNTPIEVGLPPPPLRIESITVDSGGGLRALSVNAAVLEWRGLPKSAYIIETSYSLPAWTKVETLVEEFAPGRYRAAVPRVNGNAFFRIARQR